MISKILFFALAVSFAQGAPSYQPYPPPSPPAPEGVPPYVFQYGVSDPESGNDFGADEQADGGVVSGMYKVKLADGRTQTVTYTVEGESGFVADVQYAGEVAPPAPAYPEYLPYYA